MNTIGATLKAYCLEMCRQWQQLLQKKSLVISQFSDFLRKRSLILT